MPRTHGTTAQRGYGSHHQRLRAHLVAQLNRLGVMPCARCRRPIYPWMAVDLGHTPDRTAYTGLEHAACNRRDGARRGNRRRLLDGPVIHRTCGACGKRYATTYKWQTVCSKRCADQWRARMRPIRKVRGTPQAAALCSECGGMFIPNSARQMTCGPDCARTRNGRKMREHYHRSPTYRAAVIERARARSQTRRRPKPQ